jgi:hypothetical protein
MPELAKICPVFPVRNLSAALETYRKLGFDARAYDEPIYGFLKRGNVEIHLAVVNDLDPARNMSAAYLYVDDADALFAEWSNAGADGRLHPPVDTDYDLRELAFVDADGNLLRVGSELRR